MEKEPFSWINAVIACAGVLSFGLGLVPSIEESYRLTLLLASPCILAIACLFIFLSNQDQIKTKLNELEEKLKRAEELVEIRADITELKRRVK